MSVATLLSGLWVCLIIMGCAAQHAAKVTIPADCMKVRITDFTQPCEQKKDGSLLCDGVRVRVNCVAAKP